MTLPAVTLTALEYESLLLFAVRHALRGRTYAPGFIGRQLRRSAGSLSNAGLVVIGEDIARHLAAGGTGEDRIDSEWQRAAETVRVEQAARTGGRVAQCRR